MIALDPQTMQRKWTFTQYDVTDSGILTTATDLLFTGGREGYFYALDARSGDVLWKASLGGQIVNGPITYAIDGKQYIAVISGNSLYTFAPARLRRSEMTCAACKSEMDSLGQLPIRVAASRAAGTCCSAAGPTCGRASCRSTCTAAARASGSSSSISI